MKPAIHCIGVLALFASMTPLTNAQSAPPAIRAEGTLNAADYSRQFAPGSLIAIFGSNLAPETSIAPQLPLPASLAGVSVDVSDGQRTIAAPLYFVSPGQINAQLPYDLAGPVELRVRNASGVSEADPLTLVPNAPRFFTVTQDGAGRAIATHTDAGLLSRSLPAKPGEVITFWMNSLGAVTPPLAAGMPPGAGASPGDPLNLVADSVSVQINGRAAFISYAGLVPNSPGLYQLNVRMPYDNVAGDVIVRADAGKASAQPNVTIPVEPNGFYWVVNANRFVNGQVMNGLSGSGSAFAFRQEDAAIWGENGFRSWTKNTGTGAGFASSAGIALTLKNSGVVVFDNNGIESGTYGSYYNNKGGGDDSAKIGLYTFYSMSNYLNAVWTGYFRLTAPTTFTEIIGYFDGNGQKELPFDPSNIYNCYRMNIWSNANGNAPRETGNFVGDVFSSDRTAGTFSYSDTNARRVFQDGSEDPIFRLVLTLDKPFTLPPGEYWFGHDLAVDDTPSVKAAPAEISHAGPSLLRVRPKSDRTVEQ